MGLPASEARRWTAPTQRSTCAALTAPDQTRPGRTFSPTVLAALTIVAAFIALLAHGLASRQTDDTINDRLAPDRAAPAPGFELPVLSHGSAGPLALRLGRVLRDSRLALSELRRVPVVVNSGRPGARRAGRRRPGSSAPGAPRAGAACSSSASTSGT
jgi:hypothetical protein